jgi:hypothetical protein
MGQILPLRRRFVTRAQFAESSAHAATPDARQLREDVEGFLAAGLDEPYARRPVAPVAA